MPLKTYKKGPPAEPLKGMLFSEFKSQDSSDNALPILQAACETLKPKERSRRVWCGADAPIEQKTATSKLLGLRYFHAQWGFDKLA
eukprot:5445742-Pyramimonas_sp.AAC.1